MNNLAAIQFWKSIGRLDGSTQFIIEQPHDPNNQA
jgi:hypothetical protein